MLSDSYISGIADGCVWEVGHRSAEAMAKEIIRHRAVIEEMKRMISDLDWDPYVKAMLRDLIAMHEEE